MEIRGEDYFFCDGVDMCGDVESGDVDILWRRRRCFLFVRWMWRVDVDCRGGCGWNAWLCVSMDASRECAPENCAVCALRSAVCMHPGYLLCVRLSMLCYGVWCYGRGFFRCMEARELVGCI